MHRCVEEQETLLRVKTEDDNESGKMIAKATSSSRLADSNFIQNHRDKFGVYFDESNAAQGESACIFSILFIFFTCYPYPVDLIYQNEATVSGTISNWSDSE